MLAARLAMGPDSTPVLLGGGEALWRGTRRLVAHIADVRAKITDHRRIERVLDEVVAQCADGAPGRNSVSGVNCQLIELRGAYAAPRTSLL